MAEAQVCNTGDAPLTDVLLTSVMEPRSANFPTRLLVVQSELMLLDEVLTAMSATVRGTSAIHWHRRLRWRFLASGLPQCGGGEWPIFGFTIWGEADADGTTVTDSETDSIITRSTISASANKINRSIVRLRRAGPYDIGEQPRYATPTSIWCYRIRRVAPMISGSSRLATRRLTRFLDIGEHEVTLYTDKCTNDPYVFTDITCFGTDRRRNAARRLGQRRRGGMFENSQTVSGQYCYTFVAIGNGDSVLNPYQQASSGNQQKFNGDYGNDTISVGVNNSCSLSLVKSADKATCRLVTSLPTPLITRICSRTTPLVIRRQHLSSSTTRFRPGQPTSPIRRPAASCTILIQWTA